MTNGGWDFKVERVNLDDLGIDAGQRMGMVIVQPQYDLDLDGQVPLRISDAFRRTQNALIEQAFKIREAETKEREIPISFILFPEASIPVHDPDGLDCLQQRMEQAQGDVIFIGGLEGLSPEEADRVASRFAPRVDTARPAFAAGAFVNVCVIAVKSTKGGVGWHFQAKLRPSQLEQPRNMARGRRVLYFVAPRFAFLCQICFDHIATDGEEPLNTALCRQVIETTPPAAPLDFVFVPQYNQKPDHSSMRENTGRLLKYRDRALKNDMTTVVLVNKATSAQESSEYGRSGFHYEGGRWQIPRLDVGPRGYELYLRDGVTSAVFRKRTDAIHVATLIPPSHNTGDPGNPRSPLDTPRSYLIREMCDPAPCSCLPGKPCAVGRFVECDCLPCKLRDTLPADLPTRDKKKRWRGYDADQNQLLQQHYSALRNVLLALEPARAREVIYLLLHMYENEERNNPDMWSTSQFDAVVEFLSALSVFAELQPVDFQAAPQWTARLGKILAIALLDGTDKGYSWSEIEEKYWRTFEGEYHRPDARRAPVLLVALRSRGLVEPLVMKISPEFIKPTEPNRLGDEASFAKPTPLRLYICQDALFEGARQEKAIKKFLNDKMRCVLE